MSTFIIERQEIGYDRDPEMCGAHKCRVRPVPYQFTPHPRTIEGAVNIIQWRIGSGGQHMRSVVVLCDKHLAELTKLLLNSQHKQRLVEFAKAMGIQMTVEDES